MKPGDKIESRLLRLSGPHAPCEPGTYVSRFGRMGHWVRKGYDTSLITPSWVRKIGKTP